MGCLRRGRPHPECCTRMDRWTQIRLRRPEVPVSLPVCGCGHSGAGAPGAVSRSRLAMGSAGRGPPRTVRPRRARLRPHPAPQPPSDVFSCCFLRNCWKILHHTRFPQRETSKNTAESVLNRIAQVGPSCSCCWTCGPKIRISLITPPVKQQQCFGYRGQIIHFFLFHHRPDRDFPNTRIHHAHGRNDPYITFNCSKAKGEPSCCKYSIICSTVSAEKHL